MRDERKRHCRNEVQERPGKQAEIRWPGWSVQWTCPGLPRLLTVNIGDRVCKEGDSDLRFGPMVQGVNKGDRGIRGSGSFEGELYDLNSMKEEVQEFNVQRSSCDLTKCLTVPRTG